MLELPLLELAGAQAGLVHRRQLDEIEISRHRVRKLVDAGRLWRASPRVLALAGAQRHSRYFNRRLAALDAGPSAALSHLTAASVWGLTRTAGGLHVVRPRTCFVSPSHVATVHEVRDLHPQHMTVVDGLPVTTPARTLMDLAATMPLGQVAHLLDRAAGLRLTTLGAQAAVLADVRRQGRRGVRFMEHIIEKRREHKPAESGLEYRFARILREAGLPAMRRQVNISDAEGWIARVDFLHDDTRTIAQIDGDAFHLALTASQHDDRETVRLKAAGYKVERFRTSHVLYEPAFVVTRMRVHLHP